MTVPVCQFRVFHFRYTSEARNGSMGCLLSSAREANGLSKISNPVRTAGWAAAQMRRLKGEWKRRTSGRHRFLGLADLPQQEQCVCLPGKEEGPTHAGQNNSRVS